MVHKWRYQDKDCIVGWNDDKRSFELWVIGDGGSCQQDETDQINLIDKKLSEACVRWPSALLGALFDDRRANVEGVRDYGVIEDEGEGEPARVLPEPSPVIIHGRILTGEM